MIAAQHRAEVFLQAASEALRVEDVIGAANNFRLALQCVEDPFVRQKYESVEPLAKALRHEKSIVRARAAEKGERWADAAEHFSKAHEARPDAVAAERAAYALRVSGGDLRTATALAEDAVALDGKNAACRVTLGEVYLATNSVVLAKAALEAALKLAPNDARAQQLASALRKAK